MPNVPKFLRRGGNSSSSQDDDSASASDYHRYSSDQAAENDVQRTAVNRALNTLNSGNDDTVENTRAPIRVSFVPVTPQSDELGKEVESNATGHEVKQSHQKHVHGAENNTYEKADDDSSGAWWNLLSNKGSFDTTSVAVSPMKEPLGAAASNYIKKEKMLRKKAFNRAALGGSIQFDHTFSDESSPTSLPYHHQSSSWGAGLPSKQQDEDIPIEWTRQDSSYGAAISAFGWLPKRIRKLLESFFVVLAIAILVYVVVKIGAEISHTHSSASSGGDFDLDDDDHYIAHNNNNGGEYDVGDERFRFI